MKTKILTRCAPDTGIRLERIIEYAVDRCIRDKIKSSLGNVASLESINLNLSRYGKNLRLLRQYIDAAYANLEDHANLHLTKWGVYSLLGGNLCVDFYWCRLRNMLSPKYLLRPFTKQMNQQKLFSKLVKHVPTLLRIRQFIDRHGDSHV